MENEKSPGADLLIKHLFDDITDEERQSLHQYMEQSPGLKERYEYYSDPINLRNRFRIHLDYDKDAYWQRFKAKHDPARIKAMNLLKKLHNLCTTVD